MRIDVIGDDESSNEQARTYAEYRVFAALARHADRVRGAQVTLHRVARDRPCDVVVCAVTVSLHPSGEVRTSGRGGHAYAAINRVIERLGEVMPQAAQAPSS
ncbi:MAG: HPF/RaiA family ribosome-associated protein [Acidobacteria bacterium]|nr:HPF/RaiA family ribosome-associated protein [Acidobacteriota bacterium]